MKSSKKSVKAGEIKIFNKEVIYSRVVFLLSIGRIELEEIPYLCLTATEKWGI